MPNRSSASADPTDDPDCPNDRVLRRLITAELAGEEAERLIDHVDDCAACQQRIETIDDDASAKKAPEKRLQQRLAELRFHQPVDSTETIARLLIGARSKTTADVSGQNELPDRIGNYHIVGQLACGGMSTVYQGRHLHLARDVAIKVLGEAIIDRQHARQVLNEWRTHGRLSHRNIVAATDAGLYAGLPYLVTEFVDGADLASIVRKHGPLSIRQAAAVLQEVATALDYAHREGVAHLDIKPSNIMLDREGRVLVLDMGTASAANRSIAENQSNPLEKCEIFGTLAYIAPERIEMAINRDRSTLQLTQCDFYSLGCTLHYLLTGRPPFGTVDERPDRTAASLELIRAHRKSPPPRLIESTAVAGASAQHSDCQTLIDTLMRKDPRERPKRMADVADSFNTMIGTEDSGLPLRKALADACIDLRAGSLQASTGQTIQITDLIESTASDTKQRRRFGTLGVASFLIIGFLGIMVFNRRDAAPDAVASNTPSSTSGSAGPPGWHFDPRFESGYAFRSKPLLQRMQLSDSTIHRVAIKTRTPRAPVRELAWSPSGDRLAVLTSINELRLYWWDGKRLALSHLWRQARHPIEHFCWGHGGSLFVASDHLVASLRFGANGQVEWTSLPVNAAKIESIGYLGDASSLLIIQTKQEAIGWDVAAKRRVSLPFPKTTALLQTSPDQNHLAISDENHVEVYRAKRTTSGWRFVRQCRQTPDAPFQIDTLKWSADGRLLAAGHRRGCFVIDHVQSETLGHLDGFIDGVFDHALVSFHRDGDGPVTGTLFRRHNNSVTRQAFKQTTQMTDLQVTAPTELVGVGASLENAKLSIHPHSHLIAIASVGGMEVCTLDLDAVDRVPGIERVSAQHPMQLRAASVLYRPDGGCVFVDHRGKFLGRPVPPLQPGLESGRAIGFQSLVEPELELYQSWSANEVAIRRHAEDFGIPPSPAIRHTFSVLPASSLDSATAQTWLADGQDEDWSFGRLYRPERARRPDESATEIRRIPSPDLRLISITEQPQRLAIVNPNGRYIAYRRDSSRAGTIPRTGNPPAIALGASGSKLFGASHASIGAYIWCKSLARGNEAWRVYEPQFNSACGLAVLDQNRLLVSNWHQWQIRRTVDGGLIEAFEPRSEYGFHHSALSQNRIDGSLLSGLPSGLIEPAALWTNNVELQWLAFSSGPETWLLLSKDGEILDQTHPTERHPYRFRIDADQTITPSLRPEPRSETALCLVAYHDDDRITIHRIGKD